jgi:hypothetical protein
MSYSVDLYFIMDLLLRAQFFAIQMEGLTICEPAEIRHQFLLKSKLDIFLEVVVVVPYDLIFWSSGKFQYIAAVTRLPKLFQLRNLPKAMSDMEKLAQAFSFAKNITLPVKRIAALNFIMVLVCHYTACLWLCVGQVITSKTVLTVLIFPTKIVLTVLIFPAKIILTVLVFPIKIVLTVLVFPTKKSFLLFCYFLLKSFLLF